MHGISERVAKQLFKGNLSNLKQTKQRRRIFDNARRPMNVRVQYESCFRAPGSIGGLGPKAV